MTSTRTSTARRPGGSPSRPPAPRRGGWPVRERSLLRPVLGIPPAAAIGLAVGATALGVFVDLIRIGTVGRVFEVGYLIGCVLAAGWVRRRSIFLPAVQPPLLLAVVVPGMAVLIGAPTGGGAAQSVLMAGAPLINAFPAMALTTVIVLAITAFRLVRQRLGPDDAVGRLRTRLGRDPGGRSPDGPRRAESGSSGAADRPRPESGSASRRRPDAGERGGARGSRTGEAGAARGPRTGTPGAAGGGRTGERRTAGGGQTGERGGAVRDGRTGGRTGDRGGGPATSRDTGRGSRAADPGASGASGGSRSSPTTRGGASDRTRRGSR